MMTKAMGKVALAMLLAAAVPVAAHGPAGHPPAAPVGIAQGAEATVDAFHSALKRGDTRGAAALLAEDVLIFESGEVQRSKAEYAAHHLGADAEFSAAVTSRVTHRAAQSSGNVAWIASEGRVTGNYHGHPIDLATTETMILKRGSRGWRIVQIHWSSGEPG